VIRAMPTVMIQATRDSGIGVLWRVQMSPALSPQYALDYLRELSPAAARSALLDADGRLLAGDRELESVSDDAAIRGGERVVVRDGDLTAVASDGRDAPRALLEFDLRLAMAAVRGHC